MAKFSSTALFPFLLVTVLCIGAVELGYYCLETFLLDTVATPARRTAVKGAPPAVSPGERKPSEKTAPDYTIITKRNLFGPPAGSSSTAPEPVEEELEATTLDIVLMGTIDTAGDDGRAIILNKKDRSQELYRVGDMVEGAKVKEIQRGRVILTVDGRNELLDISEARQYAQNRSPVPRRAAALRRRPAVQTEQQVEEAKPRVVRPLRRIVRPRAAIEADIAERENLELIEDEDEDLTESDEEAVLEDGEVDALEEEAENDEEVVEE